MGKAIGWLGFILAVSICIGTGCSQGPSMETEQNNKPAPQTTSTPNDSKIVTRYRESPYFNNRGLPIVDERLPLEPKTESFIPAPGFQYGIGTYGGTLRVPQLSAHERLLEIEAPDSFVIRGGVLKGYEASQDNTEFTFYMRKGLKWSDGEPVTSEDIRFMLEDVQNDKKLGEYYGAPWQEYNKGAPQLIILDDYSFQLTFQKPFPAFPLLLSQGRWSMYYWLIIPKHILKAFHTKYGAPYSSENGQPWYETFMDMNAARTLPSLDPWIYINKPSLEEDMAQNPEKYGKDEEGNLYTLDENGKPVQVKESLVVLERNPYYYKVDAEENQLTYIDTIEYYEDTSGIEALAKMEKGEMDIAYRIPLDESERVQRGQEQGVYQIIRSRSQDSFIHIFLNLTYSDPAFRKIVQNIDFRKALSLAIDRRAIVNDVLKGYGTPSTLQNEYDPAAAKQLLDKIGMLKGNGQYRAQPDGREFTIIFHSQSNHFLHDVVKRVARQWEAVGIHTVVKDDTQGGEEYDFLDMMVYVQNRFTGIAIWNPLNASLPDLWSMDWHRWFESNGKEGEEPPEEAKQYYQLGGELYEVEPDAIKAKSELLKENFIHNIWFFTLTDSIEFANLVIPTIRNFSQDGYMEGQSMGEERWYFEP